MAKVLITSIGTGKYDREKKCFLYDKLSYFSFNNPNKTYETRYFYEAYKNIFGCDKVILLGTGGSDWYSLYEYLCADNKENYNADGALELCNLFCSDNKKSAGIDTVRSMLEPIREIMGDFCLDIIVLKYGLDNGEHLENFELLKKIGSLLGDGDEVVFDITHSFRSLPLYELVSINYFKDVLKKDIKISQVTYAMAEVQSEFDNKVPIVDVTKTLSVLDCIRAVDEYKHFGTAYALADILDGNEAIKLGNEDRKALKNLTEPVSSNNIDNIKALVGQSHRITDRQALQSRSSEYRILLDYIFKDISDRFFDKLEDDYELKLAIAQWHLEKGRFFAAAVTVVESMLEYCHLIFTGSKNPSKDDKNFYRDIFSKLNDHYNYSNRSEVDDIIHYYHKVKAIRNDLCHNENEANTTQNLGNFIKRLNEIYVKAFKNNNEVITDFKATIEKNK